MWKLRLSFFSITTTTGSTGSRQLHVTNSQLSHGRTICINTQQQRQQLPFRLIGRARQQQYRSVHYYLNTSTSTTSLLNPSMISHQRYVTHINGGTVQYCIRNNIQRQQYRTRMKLIDFDQFEPEAMAGKEEKIRSDYIVGYKKKKYRDIRERDRLKKEAAEKAKYLFRYDIWEETIQSLLNSETYPVGFSNTYDSAVISSWCQQLSHTLQQTLSLNASSMSLELVLQLLDRLFQEQEAHVPNNPTAVQVLMSSDISSTAIESALKSWKFSLSFPPYYERMSIQDVDQAQERVQYYSNFLAKHEDSMLEQISKLLDVDRIVHTKTATTDRTLWGHIPHTKHPHATEANAKIYLNYMDNADSEIDIDSQYFDKNENDPDDEGYTNYNLDDDE